MSQRKIKDPLKKKQKKIKPQEISIIDAAFSHLNITRTKRKEEADDIVFEMLDKGTIDRSQTHNYKYLQKTAKDMDWTVGKLQKAIGRIITREKAIESAIKQAQKEKKNVKQDKDSEGK